MGKRHFRPGKPTVDPFAIRAARIANGFPNMITKSLMDQILEKAQRNAGIPEDFFDVPKAPPIFNPPQRKISEDDMHWQTRDGRKMLASEMATPHLFYSLRLLYNKTVEPKYRISIVNNTDIVSVEDDAQEANLRAIRILFKLLNARLNDPAREHEITDQMLEALILMQDVVRRIL